MELIIKPTGKCNFSCTFCSASELKTCNDTRHVPTALKEYIKVSKPSSIIVTGGDPLLMDPSYYYELHEIAGDGVCVSITTNLKDFFINPEKWRVIFNEPWFLVTTSFQYGSGRMWDPHTVYDEEMFIRVMDTYKKYVHGHTPAFISVISNENEDRAIDHVRLAKQIGTLARLNNALPVGRNATWYPRYKIFKIYLDLINVYDLADYEINCIERSLPNCPKNTCYTCNSRLRCCYVDPNGKLHVGICDETISMGWELSGDDIYGYHPDTSQPRYNFIKEDCACCQLCNICNGCNLNRTFAATDENYCDEMKKLEDQIIAAGWAI